VSRWTPVPQPKAALEPLELEPTTEANGDRTQVFRTANGVRFVKIVEPTGFVYWLQEVAGT